MSTVGSNFVLALTPIFNGSATIAPPSVIPLAPNQAMNACNAKPVSGSGVSTSFPDDSTTPIDRVIWDLSLTTIPPGVGANLLSFGTFIGGFAKNGALYVTLTGTTAVTIDFTNLANAVGVTFAQGGDNSLTTFGALIVKNISLTASSIVMSPGASNPSRFPTFTGTTPAITLALGDVYCQSSAAGLAVDSTHKTLTFTPSAGGILVMAWGGS
jgi:hypothetical protein